MVSDVIQSGFAWREGVSIDEAGMAAVQLLMDALSEAGTPDVFRLDITVTEEVE